MKQKIIFGISTGLLYLSTKNIIHSNIQPENILLDEEFNPLISTFDFFDQKNFINNNQTLDNLLFEAPEIMMNKEKNYNEKVDIYSWAIIVNSILTEKEPWKQLLDQMKSNTIYDQNLEFGFKIKISENERPQLIENQDYEIYHDLIERGWNPDPKIRPSIKEIVETLLESKAILPEVDEVIIKKYQKEMLSSISTFSIIIVEQLNEQIKQLKKENEEIKRQNQEQAQLIETFLKFDIKYHDNLDVSYPISQLSFAAKIDDSIGEILISAGADINEKDINYQNVK